MPLTLDEMERVHVANLEKLTFDVLDAINDGDVTRFDRLRERLMAMALDISVPMKVRGKARETHDSVAMDLMQSGLAQLAAVADGIEGAASGLRNAIRVAEVGKKELFFPSLAATVSKAVTTFEQLVKAAEKLRSELGNAETDQLARQIQGVVDAAKAVKAALPD